MKGGGASLRKGQGRRMAGVHNQERRKCDETERNSQERKMEERQKIPSSELKGGRKCQPKVKDGGRQKPERRGLLEG